jgi:putative transposase
MPQSLAQVYLHIVFSTKNRYPWLKSKQLQADVHAYLAATLNNLECPCLIAGGVEDHVHLLCRLGRTATIADVVRDVKKASSSMLHDRSGALRDFHWQSGYGAFSIIPSHVGLRGTFGNPFRVAKMTCGAIVTQGALRDPGLCSVTPSA